MSLEFITMTNQTKITALWALRLEYGKVLDQKRKFVPLVSEDVFDESLRRINSAIDEIQSEVNYCEIS